MLSKINTAMKKLILFVITLVITSLSYSQVTFKLYEMAITTNNNTFVQQCSKEAILSSKYLSIDNIQYTFKTEAKNRYHNGISFKEWDCIDNNGKNCGIEIHGGKETNGDYMINLYYREKTFQYRGYIIPINNNSSNINNYPIPSQTSNNNWQNSNDYSTLSQNTMNNPDTEERKTDKWISWNKVKGIGLGLLIFLGIIFICVLILIISIAIVNKFPKQIKFITIEFFRWLYILIVLSLFLAGGIMGIFWFIIEPIEDGEYSLILLGVPYSALFLFCVYKLIGYSILKIKKYLSR